MNGTTETKRDIERVGVESVAGERECDRCGHGISVGETVYFTMPKGGTLEDDVDGAFCSTECATATTPADCEICDGEGLLPCPGTCEGGRGCGRRHECYECDGTGKFEAVR